MIALRRLILLILALAALPAGAQPVPEYELKAAFVYNFVQFTEWPADSPWDSSPTLNLCVSASSPLSSALYALNDRAIRGRRLAVRFVGSYDALPGCHVLFLDAADRPRLAQIRKSLAGAAVLTISDDSDIIRDGVVIGLGLLDNNRMGFEVNLQAMRQARLTISSKLLRLSQPISQPISRPSH
ncbi:MAG: YfiR family protein [Pseudomonadota bacterium]|jgi:hypothetical protein